MRSSTPRWLWQLDAQHRLLITLGCAIAFFLISRPLNLGTRILVTWDGAVGCLLLLTWSVIATAHPRQIQTRAQTDDTSRLIVATLIISAASFSLFAVILLLNGSKNLPPVQESLHVALSVVAIAVSWLVVHAIFCFRYAHLYYSAKTPDNGKNHTGGLDFPSTQQPDYLDFAYFAYVIGMTAQVSDVQVSSRSMRRIVLVHSIFSFAFNTVVVALSINIISQLL